MALKDATSLLLLLLLVLVTTSTLANQGGLLVVDDDVLETCAGDEDCAERRVVSMVDALDNSTSITLLPGVVTLVQVVPVNLTREEEEEAGVTTADLDDRVDRFLRSHSVRVRLGDVDVDLSLDALRSPREATEQGRGKLRRLLIPFLLLLKFVMAIVVPLFVYGISLLSLKGLWNGLAAMTVASVLYLQSLIHPEGGPSKRISIGVGHPYHPPLPPPPPVYYHHSDYLHGGWNRASGGYDSYKPLR